MAKKNKKKPSQAEIDDQIAILTKMKPGVRRQSLFGDNHHDAIDAQILVLQTKMSEQSIINRTIFEDDEEDVDGDYEDERIWKQNVSDAARDARLWLDGELQDAEDLTTNWKDLLK